jgi:hypothetical protein
MYNAHSTDARIDIGCCTSLETVISLMMIRYNQNMLENV